jgi:hypothetical protein
MKFLSLKMCEIQWIISAGEKMGIYSKKILGRQQLLWG